MVTTKATKGPKNARMEYELALVLARRARRGGLAAKEIMASNYFTICRPDLWQHALEVAGVAN